MASEHAITTMTTGWEPGDPGATAVVAFDCPVRGCMHGEIRMSPTEGVPVLVAALLTAHEAVVAESGGDGDGGGEP